ncbi:MAG TPA: hypothetical protein VFX30_13495 [bacterium]|nr:hypothetical protein [bacterium]
MGCGDFGGTSLEDTALCLMPEGHNYAGLITDNSGHAVEVTAVDGDTVTLSTSHSRFTLRRVSEESLRVTREMAGASLVDCESRADSLGVSYTPLPSSYDGEPLSWSAADYRALTSAMPRGGVAFFCSNRENPNTVVLRSDGFHREDLYTSAELFSAGTCGEMDAAHCSAALRSIRVALGMPATETEEGHFWDLVGVGVTFTIVGIITHLIGRWIDRGGRGGGDGSGGGGGGLTADQVRALVRALSESGVAPVAELPPSSETSNSSISMTSSEGLWAGLATACFVGAAVLLADDATVVGVADDPIAGVAAVAGAVFLGISALTGEGSESSGPDV